MRDGKIGQNDRYYNIRGGTGKIAGVRTALQMKKPARGGLFHFLAERTGLEPATPGVTGRYSNRLNYRSLVWLNRETGGC
ncbi:hypothetical protein BVIET440_10213 [Burkholderia vietnamiensis]|nr:hypothetical protein BVI2075_110112 [Burkholderia vietnamiensis]CAG9223216.1 hypothetical protein BVI1335_450005 [Burkholderia vietnamiensis]